MRSHKHTPRPTLAAALLGAVLLNAPGCAMWSANVDASALAASDASTTHTHAAWRGRLGLVVESALTGETLQSLHAPFALSGNAQAGQWSVFSPVGGTQLARLQWSEAGAVLETPDASPVHAPDVDALLTQMLGSQATMPPLQDVLLWMQQALEPVDANTVRTTQESGWKLQWGPGAGRIRAEGRTAQGDVLRLRLIVQSQQ